MNRRGGLETLAAMGAAAASQTMSNGMLSDFGKDGREGIRDWAGRLSHRTPARPRGRHPDRPQSYRSWNYIHGQLLGLSRR